MLLPSTSEMKVVLGVMKKILTMRASQCEGTDLFFDSFTIHYEIELESLV